MNSEFAFEIASTIQQYPNNFKGFGKIKVYQVKFNPDKKSKPAAVPKTPVPYPLQVRVAGSLENMIKNSVLCSYCPQRMTVPYVRLWMHLNWIRNWFLQTT